MASAQGNAAFEDEIAICRELEATLLNDQDVTALPAIVEIPKDASFNPTGRDITCTYDFTERHATDTEILEAAAIIAVPVFVSAFFISIFCLCYRHKLFCLEKRNKRNLPAAKPQGILKKHMRRYSQRAQYKHVKRKKRREKRKKKKKFTVPKRRPFDTPSDSLTDTTDVSSLDSTDATHTTHSSNATSSSDNSDIHSSTLGTTSS